MQRVPYASTVDNLIYVMFLSNLGKEHWEAMKWIMRYKLCSRTEKLVLVGYTDAE
ncbi:hypothetical protein RJ641_036536, partial [Dillenia turbinata]